MKFKYLSVVKLKCVYKHHTDYWLLNFLFQGNYTAFAFKKHNYTKTSRHSGRVYLSCGHYFVKVGEFHEETVQNITDTSDEKKGAYIDNKGKKLIRYSPKENIDWPGGHKPVDEPHCGYLGERCVSNTGRTQIATVVLGGMLCYFMFVILSALS